MTDTAVRIRSLTGNSMKLDGGAMFGNAPKALWSRWLTPDDQNLIDVGSRALCIMTPHQTLLFETGPGAYLSPDMKKRFQVPEARHVLLDSLDREGLAPEDITHVVLSHLHFDHAGGLLNAWEPGNETLGLVFPRAEFICGEKNFQRSRNPHFRDRASFIPGLGRLMEDSGRLRLVSDGQTLEFNGLTLDFIESSGHTPGMILTRISIRDTCIYFAGDIAPGPVWVNLPVTMGYDRNPERLIDEKQQIFARIAREDAWIFYTHDTQWAASKISFDETKKRFVPDRLLAELTLDL